MYVGIRLNANDEIVDICDNNCVQFTTYGFGGLAENIGDVSTAFIIAKPNSKIVLQQSGKEYI